MTQNTASRNIALVVDAACDLPQTFLKDRNIVLLPTSINVNGTIYTDDKDPVKLEHFYQQGLLTKKNKAESIAYSAEQISQLVRDKLVPNYDCIIVQTVSQKKSLIYENVQQASHSILQYARAWRTHHKKGTPFIFRTMNSGTLFCGQGALAAYTSDLIAQGKSNQEVLQLSRDMCDHIHAFIVPPSVDYVRERARKKGEDSVGFLASVVARSLDIVPIITGRNDETQSSAKIRGFDRAVESLFQHAIAYMEEGLLSPYVVVSIAGNLISLLELDAYQALEQRAKDLGITVLPCVMGLTSGVNVGPGSIGMGFLAEDKDIPFTS